LALGADRQNHGFGLDNLAALQAEREVVDLARDFGNVGVEPDIDFARRDLLVPGTENPLTLAGIEIEIGAQHQIAGRRHHVLALLIFEDRIAQMIGLFDQHVAQTQ
jgi:hypothetical protein